jgi:phospholipid/cholesterol/gamma-HCH transport system substrate-binding protein
MVQSESNKTNESKDNKSTAQYHAPKKHYGLEFWVGLFAAISLACLAYLAVGLGELEIFSSNKYYVMAEFDNISGVQVGASVEIAGVKIGDVTDIILNTDGTLANVKMHIDSNIKLRDDDIASIRTKGIIGDRYVKVIPGASEDFIPAGGEFSETESVVDIEDLIGKFVHSLGKDKESDQE